MTAVISRSSLRGANARSMSGRRSKASLDSINAQINCKTLFGTQTVTVSRARISQLGRGRK